MSPDDYEVSRMGVPKLEDWLTFPDAGRILGVSKQMIHKMVFTLGLFDVKNDIRSVGEKPIYVVREKAVLALKEKRGGQQEVE